MYVEHLSSLNHMPQQNHNDLNFYKIWMLSKDLKQGNFLGIWVSRLVGLLWATFPELLGLWSLPNALLDYSRSIIGICQFWKCCCHYDICQSYPISKKNIKCLKEGGYFQLEFFFSTFKSFFIVRLGFLIYFGACYGACIIFSWTLTTSHFYIHMPRHLITFLLVGIIESTWTCWPSTSATTTRMWDWSSHHRCGTIQTFRFYMDARLPWLWWFG